MKLPLPPISGPQEAIDTILDSSGNWKRCFLGGKCIIFRICRMQVKIDMIYVTKNMASNFPTGIRGLQQSGMEYN